MKTSKRPLLLVVVLVLVLDSLRDFEDEDEDEKEDEVAIAGFQTGTYCARTVPWLVMGMNTPLPQWMSSTAERRAPRREPAVPAVVVACDET